MPKQIKRYGTATIKPDGYYDIKMQGHIEFRELIGRGREYVEIEHEIREKQEPKTNPQLAYWKGPIRQAALMGFRGLGYEDVRDMDDAEHWLKLVLYYEEVKSPITGQMERKPKSLKGYPKRILAI